MVQRGHGKGEFICACDGDGSDKIDGEIFTNLTQDELLICLGGNVENIPHSGFQRCHLKKSANQLISNSFSDVVFDLELFDIGETHDNSINNHIINIKKDGTYLIAYKVEIDASANINYETRIELNGSDYVLKSAIEASPTVSNNAFISSCGIYNFNKNDYLSLQAKISSASNRNIVKDGTFICVIRIF